MSPGIVERRVDLDWLRVIAFGLLVFFHAAIPFVDGGMPRIQNPETSLALEWFVVFLHEFRLSLLFLISGVGVCFALRRRDAIAFQRDRARRLLIPLAFGVLVLVPPMVWLEHRHLGTFTEGLGAFYAGLFTTGLYPDGHLSWHHFWFVAYLWVFCAVGAPVFRRLRSPIGEAELDAITRFALRGPGLYAFALVLLLPELLLRPLFPGFRDLIHDWASVTHWFAVFLAGFAIAARRALLERAETLRTASLLGALACTSILVVRWRVPGGAGFTPFPDGNVTVAGWVAFSSVRVLHVWCWLLACLGWGARLLQRPGPVLRYLNEAVYPLFCLHLTATVVLTTAVLDTDWGLWTRWCAVSVGTIGMGLLGYEVVRRIPLLRPLLGLPPSAGQTTRHGAIAPPRRPLC